MHALYPLSIFILFALLNFSAVIILFSPYPHHHSYGVVPIKYPFTWVFLLGEPGMTRVIWQNPPKKVFEPHGS